MKNCEGKSCKGDFDKKAGKTDAPKKEESCCTPKTAPPSKGKGCGCGC